MVRGTLTNPEMPSFLDFWVNNNILVTSLYVAIISIDHVTYVYIRSVIEVQGTGIFV